MRANKQGHGWYAGCLSSSATVQEAYCVGGTEEYFMLCLTSHLSG